MRILALVAALLVIPAAAAQLPASPSTAEMSISPGSPLGIVKLGSSGSTSFTVDFELTNVFCPNGASGTINIALADVPSALPGLTATLSATSIAFDIPATSATTSVTKSDTITLNVTVLETTTNDHEHAFNVTASFAQSDLEGSCVAVTSAGPGVPGARASSDLMMKTGPALVTETPTNGTNSTSSSNEDKGSPSFSMPMAGVLLVALALVVRRKQ